MLALLAFTNRDMVRAASLCPQAVRIARAAAKAAKTVAVAAFRAARDVRRRHALCDRARTRHASGSKLEQRQGEEEAECVKGGSARASLRTRAVGGLCEQVCGMRLSHCARTGANGGRKGAVVGRPGGAGRASMKGEWEGVPETELD